MSRKNPRGVGWYKQTSYLLRNGTGAPSFYSAGVALEAARVLRFLKILYFVRKTQECWRLGDGVE
jgi:hypothetical protein